MRTLDTSAVISKALGRVENYPAGSLSKREVIANLDFATLQVEDPVEYGEKLNGRLTAAIYKHWQETDLLKPKAWTVARDELTKVVQDLFGA
jgi:hypothetical protein